MISMPNAIQDEVFEFGSLEEIAHDHVIDIVVFYQPTSFASRQFLQAIDLRDDWYHVLTELLHLHHYIFDLFNWGFRQLVVKLPIDGP